MRETRDGSARAVGLSVLLLLATVVWGWTFPVVKDAVAAYGVVGFLAVRFAIAALAMAPLGLSRGMRRSWMVGGAIGALLAASYLLQTFGIRHTSATNSGLITGLFVVFAPLWARALYGVRIDAVSAATVAVSVVGLGLLTGLGLQRPSLGDMLTLGCAVGFGLHIALLDRYARDHDPGALTAAQLAASALVFLAAWPLCEPLAAPSRAVWGALLLTGLAATAGGFTIQTAAQRHLPAVRVAVILTMEPVFATIFGRVLAGDRLQPAQLAGGALMVGALLVANVHQARRDRPTDLSAA